jgi:hypothetical protein
MPGRGPRGPGELRRSVGARFGAGASVDGTERLDKSPGVEAAKEAEESTAVALGAHTLAELVAEALG